MYYALSNLRDGHAPGVRQIDRKEDALPGEAVVSEPPGENDVWDEASKSVRPLAEEEVERKRFEAAKNAKIVEISGYEQRTLMALFDEATELAATQTVPDLQITYGSLKALFLALAPVIEQNLAPSEKQVLQQARSKVENARGQLLNMSPQTPEEYRQKTGEVNAITWESL